MDNISVSGELERSRGVDNNSVSGGLERGRGVDTILVYQGR